MLDNFLHVLYVFIADLTRIVRQHLCVVNLFDFLWIDPFAVSLADLRGILIEPLAISGVVEPISKDTLKLM